MGIQNVKIVRNQQNKHRIVIGKPNWTMVAKSYTSFIQRNPHFHLSSHADGALTKVPARHFNIYCPKCDLRFQFCYFCHWLAGKRMFPCDSIFTSSVPPTFFLLFFPFSLFPPSLSLVTRAPISFCPCVPCFACCRTVSSFPVKTAKHTPLKHLQY